MKHLSIFSSACLLFVGIASCTKVQAPQPEGTQIQMASARKGSSTMSVPNTVLNPVDFKYHLEKDPLTQEWLCPEPMDDCRKISPSKARLTAINTAIATGTVASFFSNSNNVLTQFPYLADQPQLISGLAQGTLTMVLQQNANGTVVYLIVPVSAVSTNGSPLRTDQVVHAIMVNKSN